VRTALGVAWLSVYAVALMGAANDVIATRLQVSVNDVTRTVRIGLFVVPVLAFLVTKRLALGLQRRDRDNVLHGRESGVNLGACHTGRSSGDGRTGAHFSAELGKAFWVTPADHTNPGPVTDWRRVGP
jgi:hypothetical protein